MWSRIADWFGVETVFVSDDCVDLYNPKVIQSSMGSIFRVRVVTADLADLARRFHEAGMRVYGTFLHGNDLSVLDPERNALKTVVKGVAGFG